MQRSGPKCEAKTRSGRLCKHPAGFRTDHPGQGRCWLHGGATPIKHGGYSKYLRGQALEAYKTLLTEPNPWGLQTEIALLRSFLIQILVKWAEQVEKGAGGQAYLMEYCQQIVKIIGAISRIVERSYRIECSKKMIVDAEEIDLFVEQIINIIVRRVPEQTTREAISQDLRHLGDRTIQTMAD